MLNNPVRVSELDERLGEMASDLITSSITTGRFSNRHERSWGMGQGKWGRCIQMSGVHVVLTDHSIQHTVGKVMISI